MTAPERPPFWKTKRLHEVTRSQYEAICDGCARCCLVKLEDEDKSYAWLPPTCGYRLVAEGRDLYWWHPLVSGDPDTVHAAGISVRGKVAGFEQDFSDDELGHHLVLWPARVPPGAKARVRQPAKPESRSSSRPTPLASRRRAAIVQGK
jgi:uncharacterized cysteine cluster protein YcgN (CxxCxxCC family)